MRLPIFICLLLCAIPAGANHWGEESYFAILDVPPSTELELSLLVEAAKKATAEAKIELAGPSQERAIRRIGQAFLTLSDPGKLKNYYNEWTKGPVPKEEKQLFSKLKSATTSNRMQVIEQILSKPRHPRFWYNALNMLIISDASPEQRPASFLSNFSLLLERGLPETVEFDKALNKRFYDDGYSLESLVPILTGRRFHDPKLAENILHSAPNQRTEIGMAAMDIARHMKFVEPDDEKWTRVFNLIVSLYGKPSNLLVFKGPLSGSQIPVSYLRRAIAETPLEWIGGAGSLVTEYADLITGFLKRDPSLVEALSRLDTKPHAHTLLSTIIENIKKEDLQGPGGPVAREILERMHSRYPRLFPEDYLRALANLCAKKHQD